MTKKCEFRKSSGDREISCGNSYSSLWHISVWRKESARRGAPEPAQK
jgi:hypothetical protein